MQAWALRRKHDYAHPWQFWKKINIKAVFLFGPESNLPSFFFLFWKIPALRWGAFIRSAIRKTTFMLDFYITMLKLFDRRGMRCSPYSSSVINTNHVVNIVSAPKSVNVPYQSGKSTLPNVSLSIRKKHPSKLQLKSITFQILQNLLFQWRVIVWMNTHVGLELDGRGVFLGRHFSSLNRPFGDPGRSLMCATSLT